MIDLQTIKIIIAQLKALGYGNQSDIGKLIGYLNESAFSQVVNGRVAMPGNFIERLLNIDIRIKESYKKSLGKDFNSNTLEEPQIPPLNKPKPKHNTEMDTLKELELKSKMIENLLEQNEELKQRNKYLEADASKRKQA